MGQEEVHNMRVLLRSADTKLYCSGSGHWGDNPAEAVDFEEIERAAQVCRKEGWRNMEVVLDYENPVCELVLPVKSDW